MLINTQYYYYYYTTTILAPTVQAFGWSRIEVVMRNSSRKLVVFISVLVNMTVSACAFRLTGDTL